MELRDAIYVQLFPKDVEHGFASGFNQLPYADFQDEHEPICATPLMRTNRRVMQEVSTHLYASRFVFNTWDDLCIFHEKIGENTANVRYIRLREFPMNIWKLGQGSKCASLFTATEGHMLLMLSEYRNLRHIKCDNFPIFCYCDEFWQFAGVNGHCEVFLRPADSDPTKWWRAIENYVQHCIDSRHVADLHHITSNIEMYFDDGQFAEELEMHTHYLDMKPWIATFRPDQWTSYLDYGLIALTNTLTDGMLYKDALILTSRHLSRSFRWSRGKRVLGNDGMPVRRYIMPQPPARRRYMTGRKAFVYCGRSSGAHHKLDRRRALARSIWEQKHGKRTSHCVQKTWTPGGNRWDD